MGDSVAAKAAVIQEFRRLATRYSQINAIIADLNAEKQGLEARANDCHAAARLFGFDLIAEAAKLDGPPQSPSAPALSGALPPEAPAPKTQISVRKFVLNAAKMAHPQSVRASDLRHELEQAGMETHEKTVGMTLYRLLKKGLVRRVKADWFYVPAADREGRENSGAGAPELFNESD